MTDFRLIARLGVWVAALAVMCAVPAVLAQEGGDLPAPLAGEENPVAAPAAAAPAEKSAESLADSEDDSIMGMVLNSGPTGLTFLVVLILFSLAAVTVGLERAVNTRQDRIVPATFLGDLRTLLGKSDVRPNEFEALCEKTPSPVARILRAGLLRTGRPVPEVEKSMEDAAAREMAEIRGGIKPLSVIGAVAPLVGLLGTVLGMIIAFRTASQEGLGRGELMAQGIYMALLTTAAGLTIAIPCLLLAALYNSRVEKYFREIDKSLMETMPCFARLESTSKTEQPS
jgi:biopolymer transport protein ExbB